LKSAAKTGSAVSGGSPSACAINPAPTTFTRIGLPAFAAISLRGAAIRGGSVVGTSAMANPPLATPERKCGRCSGLIARRMSASSLPARTGSDPIRIACEFLPPRILLM
jgi:hypothetical protein